MTPRDVRFDALFRRGTLRLLLAAAACVVAQGCGPSDPLEGKVDAPNELSYSMWRAQAERDLAPEQVKDVDRSMQEIKFHIMAVGAASGSDAVEAAALKEVDGLTVRHMLQEGLSYELDRAQAEKSALETGMKNNAFMTTRPGDTDSADYLAALKERQSARLKAATEEVDHARERLAAAGGPIAATPGPSPSP